MLSNKYPSDESSPSWLSLSSASPSSILRLNSSWIDDKGETTTKRHRKFASRPRFPSFLLDIDEEDTSHEHNNRQDDPESRFALRRVTFSLPVATEECTTHQAFSEDEIQSYWYSSDEIQFLQEKDAFLFDTVMSGTCQLDEDKYTLRGLEYHDSAASCFAVNTVLREQDSQRRQGTIRPDWIANVYIMSSHYAKKEGIRMGQMDAEEACRVIWATRNHQIGTTKCSKHFACHLATDLNYS